MSIHPNSTPTRDSSLDQEKAPSNVSYQARREEVFRQRREREKRQREEDARASRQRRSESTQSNREEGDLFETGDKALNDWTSESAASNYDDLPIQDGHSADDVVQTLFAALNRMRAERDTAISVILILIKERSRIRAHMVAQDCAAERSKSLYRKVGLDEHCPNHVLTAARRSFRVILHPDTYPAHMRGEAERRFKETEAIFEEIKRLRGP
jgi:hypothetical protein